MILYLPLKLSLAAYHWVFVKGYGRQRLFPNHSMTGHLVVKNRGYFNRV